jgi:hypothetical protein
MLYFATKPDPVFAAIVDAALCYGLDVAADPEQWNACAHVRRFFSRQTATWVLRDLRSAHKKPTTYQMSDFHWILLHTFLQEFCEQHNDRLEDAERWHEESMPVGDYLIGQIFFQKLITRFFWDVEALPWASGITPSTARPFRGITDRRNPIKAGKRPELADLHLTHIRWPQWQLATLSIPSGTEIPLYPPITSKEEALPDPAFF